MPLMPLPSSVHPSIKPLLALSMKPLARLCRTVQSRIVKPELMVSLLQISQPGLADTLRSKVN